MIRFFYGENDFLIKRATDNIANKFVQEHRDESLTKIDAHETDADQIIAEIVNINMFAPRRLVVIQNVAANKHAWERIGEALGRVPNETDVILVATKPDKRTKTFKLLAKMSGAKEFTSLSGAQLTDFVSREAEDLHMQLTRDGRDALIRATGGDLWRVTSELAKMKSLPGKIDTAKITEFIEPDIEANAFSILHLVVSGRHTKMVEELTKLRQVEDAHKFLGLLSSQIQTIAAVKLGADKSDQEIAKDFTAHPYAVKQSRDLARRMSVRDIQNMARAVAEADIKMKTSGTGDNWLLIEIALAKITH